MPGYSRCHEALRQGAAEGRGGVAQLWADDLSAQAELWRSRSADGVLWVIIHSLLERPLLVGTCYLPPKGSGGCPSDLDGWWLRLALDVADAAGTGSIILTGDLNARTGSLPDWPEDGEASCTPRTSMDTAPANSHGRSLLQLCIAAGLRICNGRCGPSSGMATSFGVRGNGQAVADYVAVSEALLPHVVHLEVLGWHPAALQADHATLHLEMELVGQPQRGAAEQPPACTEPEWQPAPQQRQFRRPKDPQQLQAAVEQLTLLCGQLAALADAADTAETDADLAGLAGWMEEAVCSAMAAAGIRQQRQGPQQRQLPRHLRQEFGIRQLRRAKRRVHGESAQRTARNELKRQLRRAYRAAACLRGEANEELLESNPTAFFQSFNRMQQQQQQQQVAHAATEEASQQPSDSAQQQLASLAARMHAPFTAADVAAHCRRLKARKAVAGSLAPWFLKAASNQLASVCYSHPAW
ncbi:hypothetical protein ABPG77_007387 [Micractinium sp. CCAP 211/92]